MNDDEYLALDALALAAAVRDGDTTAAELLACARSRADRVDGQLNAICRRMDEHADTRAAGDLSGPFAGVPFLLKDLHQDLGGVPTPCGSRSLAAELDAAA